MNADIAQGLVARCLVDAEFFDRCEAQQRARQPEASPKYLQLAKVARFRGFITRIKHTQLRKVVPGTLRLLGLYRLDISLFTAMAPDFQKARMMGSMPIDAMLLRLETAVNARLATFPQHVRAPVEAVLRHEMRLFRMARSNPTSVTSQPRLSHDVAIERYMLDVLALSERLAQNGFEVPDIVLEPRDFLYRRVSTGIYCAPLDAFSAYVLSRMDGVTPVAELARDVMAALGHEAAGAVDDLVADAMARGLVMAATARDLA
ncbi:PqqD family protein [Sphingomonas qilianensis]|uniref:Uncharacterized protein n=1 Tax=Sphingomonas qilianensis TaxID=1736690 RepID=A0ABU9XVI1_9SPHN